MIWQHTPLTIPLIVGGIATAFLATRFWTKDRSSESGIAAVLMLAVAFWSLTYALELASVSLEAKHFWSKVEYIGIVIIPLAWFWFALQYTGRAKWLTLRNLMLLSIVPAVTLALAWTNDAHRLLWADWKIRSAGAFTLQEITHGVWFHVNVGYSYALSLGGTLIIVQAFIRSHRSYRGQITAMLIAAFAPWLGNAIYLSGRGPFHPLDLTPFGFIISAVAVAWGLLRFRLFDLRPVGRDSIIESIGDIVIVLDAHGRIVDLNPAAERIAGIQASASIGQPLSKTFSDWSELADLCGEVPTGPVQIERTEGESKRQFELRTSSIRDRQGRGNGRVLILHETTERKRMERELQKHREGLEQQVRQRTRELSETNRKLLREADEHAKAEKALRESEGRYRMLVEEARDIICTIDMKSGTITGANDFGSKTLGYKPEDISNKMNFLQLVHPEDQEKVINRMRGLAFEKKRVPNFPFRLVKSDGTAIHVEINSAVTYDAEGNPETFIGILRDVSEQRLAETALRESEKRYRILVDNSLTGVCIIQDEKYCFVNERASEMTGYTQEELLGMPMSQVVYPDDHEHARGVIGRRMSGDAPATQYQFRGITKSGELRWVETFGAPIEYQGRPALLVNWIDITERKKTEEALQLTQFIVDNAPDLIYWMGADGRLVYVNEAACQSLGYFPEELLSMTIHDIDPNFPQEMWAQRWKELKKHRNFVIEEEHRTKDGTIFPVLISANYLEFLGKEYNCVVAHDISNRKAAEEQIRMSEERYRALFEESKDCVFSTSPQGAFLDINPAGVELFGYSSREELLEMDLRRDIYINPEDRDLFQSVIARQNFVKDYEILLRRKDGKPLNILVTANTVRDNDGTIVAYRGFMRDITEQKQLEQQLLQAQKMEGIGTLAGGIAHDFNNILGGILGYASFIKTKMDDTHPFYKYVNTIEAGAMRAAELTSQLLAFARGGKYETEPVNLNRIADETVRLLERTLDKSIEINIRLHPELPTVEADAGQMQQVLMNLCVNAGDAMPTGGRLVIETGVEGIERDVAGDKSVTQAGTYVTLSVIDDGIGMDARTQQRIFEPFFTTKEEGKGTGLGLAMVYGVIKNHGGFVDVQSAQHQGTTFKVHLPATEATEVFQSLDVEELQGGDELILVVDDEEEIRTLAREILETYGYRVLTAEDGAGAIEIFQKQNGAISMVILDMVMPKMGGRETYLQMRSLNPEVRVLLSTGYTKDGKAQEILDSGVMGFVQKPYQVSSLLSSVRKVLDADASVI